MTRNFKGVSKALVIAVQRVEGNTGLWSVLLLVKKSTHSYFYLSCGLFKCVCFDVLGAVELGVNLSSSGDFGWRAN